MTAPVPLATCGQRGPTSGHRFGDVLVLNTEDGSHTNYVFEPSAPGASGVSVTQSFVIQVMASGASEAASNITVL